jgi:hypothetical protein
MLIAQSGAAGLAILGGAGLLAWAYAIDWCGWSPPHPWLQGLAMPAAAAGATALAAILQTIVNLINPSASAK